jgi:DNA repair ATPase RecN
MKNTQKKVHDETKFNNLEDLRERVVDLPESERQEQETSNEIQKALLGLVNEKNEKANGYEKEFKRWVEGKVAKKERRQSTKEMKAKYGTEKPDMETIEKHKAKYSQKDYKKILEDIKKQHKSEEGIKDDIFTIIKRAFNKNITLHEGTDIDKETSLFLLKITGFFKDQDKKLELRDIIKEVPQGEVGKKGLSIDT